MVFGTQSKEGSSQVMNYVKTYSIPVYIMVSVVFILYVLWSYAMGVVYNAGVIAGQGQALEVGQERALQAGQEQGYVAALEQLFQEATKESCEVVSLTLGESQVNLINVDCLDMGQDDMMFDDEMFFEE